MKLQAISYNKCQSSSFASKRKNTIFGANNESSQTAQSEKKKNKVRDWLVNFCIVWTIADVIEDIWKWCNKKKPPLP